MKRSRQANPVPAIAELFRVLNYMVDNGYMLGYAIGGGWGMNMHDIEPIYTSDIDVFFYPSDASVSGVVTTITAGVEAAMGCRAKWTGHHLDIYGIDTQFIAADKMIVRRAIDTAVTKRLFGMSVRAVRLEYLIAIAEKVARAKDLYKAEHMLGYPHDAELLAEARSCEV